MSVVRLDIFPKTVENNSSLSTILTVFLLACNAATGTLPASVSKSSVSKTSP